MINISLRNETDFTVPTDPLRAVVHRIVADHGFDAAEISLAIVDDSTIHRLNCEYLNHDYPTDVLSFVLEDDGVLEGEVIVSADTAIAIAPDYQWDPVSELLLYFIHGTLHLVGYDDHNPSDCATMRERESFYLRFAGMDPPLDHERRISKDQEASA